MEKKELKHESFGLLGFSRSQRGGKGTNLFGSSILHGNTITMTLYRAVVDRNLNQDWYHADRGVPIVEVEMSQTQFAEIITSMNMGDGFPVTIRSVEGKRTEPCPFENKRMQHASEFKETMVKLGESLRNTQAQLLSTIGKLPKKDQENAKSLLNQLIQEIDSNIPYYETQFERQMNKTVTEAKGEVEAFIQSKITNAGLTALKKGDQPITSISLPE